MNEFDGGKEPEMSEGERERRLRDGTLAVPGLVYYPGYTLEMALASVGPGWRSLVQETFDAVSGAKVGAVVTQVKEKWGALRINLGSMMAGHASRNLLAMIDAIERASERTCEGCGASGRLRGEAEQGRSARWRKTLCDQCAHRFYDLNESAWLWPRDNHREER